MDRFRYIATTAEGGRVRGRVQAADLVAATTVLHERGLEITRLVHAPPALTLRGRRLRHADLMHLSRQLSAFLRAGVPILEALDGLADDLDDRNAKRVLGDMAEALRRGDSFATAAEAHADAFPPFYLSVLRSAEVTGQLDDVLERLATYLDRDLEARRRVTSALTYPALIFLLSIVTVVILTGFVLPRFRDFFESLDAQLPPITRALVTVTAFITTWWPVMVGTVVALIIIVVLGVRTDRGRYMRDRVLLAIPAGGTVARFIAVERFCRILSSMVRAGVPLPDALRLASRGTNNHVFQRSLERAREEMLEGEGLAQPLSRTELFPRAVTQMLRVGEDTGALDEQLEVMAGFYEKEVEFRLKRLTSLFEPAAIVFMGLIVGFVALALISAMYGIYQQVEL